METSTAGNVVEIQLDLTPQDYVCFSWWHLLHNTAFRISLVAAASVLAVIVSSVLRPSRPSDVTGDVVFGGLFLGFWLVLIPIWIGRSARQQFATQQLAQESHQATFSADGVALASASQSAQQLWRVFWRAIETPGAFYLYVSTRAALVLPKRCFTSPEQMQRFRDLVHTAMGEKARRVRK
jgi:hypothetical protein